MEEISAPEVPRCGRCGLPFVAPRLDGEKCGPCKVAEIDKVIEGDIKSNLINK